MSTSPRATNAVARARRIPSKPSIRVQSIIYHLAFENIERALEHLDNAARNAVRQSVSTDITIALGDCSPTPTLSDAELADLRARYKNLAGIDYTFFGANLGSAAGHNRLMEAATCDLLVIQNPDVVVAPTIFEELVQGLSRPGVGMVEARQLPIEHPKYYDPITGETGWASTACAMIPMGLMRELGGFDAETFFLYGDDVDFSWRVRLAGQTVVHQCSAVVFHDKRLSQKGNWLTTSAERYYSAECGLLLPYKYSRGDLTERIVSDFRASGDSTLLKAAEAFELRRKTGRLPKQLDPDHKVAEFINGAYTLHRYQAS